jgi:uncharacterized membrane protein YdjX (TVP38/TMEM64 family)
MIPVSGGSDPRAPSEPDRPRPLRTDATQVPAGTTRSPPAAGRTELWAWVPAGAFLAALGTGWYLLPVGAWLGGTRDWIVGLGFEGVAIFVAIYAVGAVILAPEAALTIGAGFAYGFWGLPIVLVAATIGASLAFLLARHLAREKVRRLLQSRRRIAAIDKAVAEDGWKIVALFRLSPLIPFNLQNYLFGVSAIPFRHFVAATAVGIIPGSALYTCLGVAGNAAVFVRGPEEWTLFGIGLGATAIVVVLVAAKARAKLREAGVDGRAG